ncbi:methytransferase partner Trm112 [Chloroflexota bacterium]
MKKELMDIIVCPVCKGALQLKVVEEQGNEVITGSLLCQQCSRAFPINEAIPSLIPPNFKD